MSMKNKWWDFRTADWDVVVPDTHLWNAKNKGRGRTALPGHLSRIKFVYDQAARNLFLRHHAEPADGAIAECCSHCRSYVDALGDMDISTCALCAQTAHSRCVQLLVGAIDDSGVCPVVPGNVGRVLPPNIYNDFRATTCELCSRLAAGHLLESVGAD